MRQPIYDAMTMLMRKASDNLTPDDWLKLTDLADAAASEARRLAEVTDGIASLVAYDGSDHDGLRSGCFQDAEGLFPLLCSLSHSFETVAAMAEVGSYAASQLIQIPQPEVKP